MGDRKDTFLEPRPAKALQTGPGTPGGPTGEEQRIREAGPRLVNLLFSAIKTVQVHDLANRAAQRVLSELDRELRKLFALDDVVSIQITPDYIHINDVRLNMDSQNYGPFSYVLEGVRERDVEIIELRPDVTAEEMGIFLKVFFGDVPDEDMFGHFEAKLAEAGVSNISIIQWVERERHLQAHSDDKRDIRKESTKVFFRTVLLMGEVLKGIEQKRVLKVQKAERLTQQMVDIIQADESILVGLTSIKAFDEYTFTHSVNVCVLSMLIADRLHLFKSDIARLGVAALLHDIGKTYVPQSVLNNPSRLDGRDWELMKYHTFFGVKELSRVRATREVIDAAFVALQHHVHYNGDGYPQRPDGWDLRLFTRIVTVADYYDAMTTPRIYKMDPVFPDRALRFILLKSGQIFDPLIAKVFIQAIGIYPIGTVVELDTGERGVVVRQNDSSRLIHRPLVTPLLHDGTISREVEPFDLSEHKRSGCGYRRSIVRTLYDKVIEEKKAKLFAAE